MDINDINPHLGLLQSETATSDFERRWLRFCADVRAATGLESLDGDQVEDGFSLDWVHDMFSDGADVEQVAAEIAVSRDRAAFRKMAGLPKPRRAFESDL